MIKQLLTVVLCLCAYVSADASFLPFFDTLRTAITERQTAISNAPPITAEGKKELKALAKALKTIDKSSTSLRTDLSILSSVTAGINKGASNETFALHLSTAISNYVGVLVQTNDALEATLADANNNPALKQKAQDLLETAQAELAAIQPENDMNGAAKGIGKVLSRYTAAAKAVAAAAAAEPRPLPNPQSGTVVIEAAGRQFTFQARFPLRNETFTRMVNLDNPSATHSSDLLIHIPSGGAPGTYAFVHSFNEVVDGQTWSFFVSGSDAQVTAASSSTVAGNYTGTGTYSINGGASQQTTFSARFNGKPAF